MEIIDQMADFVERCTDELIALTVIGGYMAGHFMGVIVPEEAPIIVLTYYFVTRHVTARLE